MTDGVKIIHVDVFNFQVAVFASNDLRVEHLKALGVTQISDHDLAAHGTAHVDRDDDGRTWFSMVLPPAASIPTMAHECVHIADWLMETLGIPSDAHNTEVRAYLVGHLLAGVLDDGDE